MNIIRSRIAEAILKTSIILAHKGLNGRYKTIKYRLRTESQVNSDSGTVNEPQNWDDASIIEPNPIIKNRQLNYSTNIPEQKSSGILTLGDIQIKINLPLFTKEELESFEFNIDGDIYTPVGGQIIEEFCWWILYLRKIL